MEQDTLLVDLSSLILEDENQNNIKLGDVIYLKSYLPEENKGLISGEGFGTNKLECLQLQKVSNQHLAYKQAELNIYRCLFRIIDNNYSFDKQAAEIHNEHNTNNIDQLENETNLVYGQEIQLLHLYSKCFLCLNSQVLAKENCCRELKLEANITQNSSFMFQSNTKNSGEPVLYGDILLLKSSVPHLNQWGLGVQQNEPYSEVHASQIPSTLRVCSYNENLDVQNTIINGDIIVLKNRFFGGFLSVKRKISSTNLFQNRQLFRNDKKINQKFLDIQVFKNQEKLEKLFQFNLESEIKPNSMWLLLGINYEQNQQNKKDYIKQKKTYLIKNVLTGAFLSVQNNNLNLTFDFITDKCEFYIRNQQKIDAQIQVGEFYRIIQKSFTYVVQCEDKNQVSVSQKSSKIQFDQQLFQVKRGQFDEAMTANKIQSFYFEIVEFYQYLQEWGLDQAKNYSYLIAFKQQKQLQDEINQFAKLLQNIHSFLNLTDDISQKQINQFYLCSYDIFDLLISLQQLICQITYQENNFTSTLADKTAQRIARQKFDPYSTSTKKKQFNLVEEIYLLIYSIIFDNLQCCDYIIEQDDIIDFLMSQLNSYREIIEKILKQLVSKAKFNSGVANKWINRIKIITEENLEDQIFIIKIINLLIQSQFHISIECQNLCRKKLFLNNESKLIKCLIKNDEQPLIHFVGNENSFRSANSKFCWFLKFHYPASLQNEVHLELFAKWDNEKLYYGYEQYILGVLNLFASMCKGRNYKNMILIKQSIGINLKFFEKVKMIKHSLLCKQIMIDLYLSLYFDIDPLAKISTFENTCYLRQELVDFSLDTESGVFFYENISSKNIKTTDVYSTFKMSILNLQQNTLELLNLKHFTKHIIYSQKFHQQFIQLFLSEQYPDYLIEDSNAHLNYKQIAKTQLNFFLSLIILIKESVELGYNNLAINLAIQSQLPFIFIALIIQQKNKFKTYEFQEDFAFQRNIEKLRQSIKIQIKQQNDKFDFIQGYSWITEFLIWTTSTYYDIDLIENIFQQSLNIYRVFFYLQENLQILYYLKHRSFKSENLFIDHNSLLFHCLFGQQKFPRLNMEILNYLVLSFNQQQKELQEIKEVEILDDEVELRYFSKVNGHTENQDNLGPKEIYQHVKKALRFMNTTQQEKSGKEKENEQSFTYLQKYLEEINQLFEELQQNNSTYLHSLQNMIRNASIHMLFVDFFINPNDIISNVQVVYFYRNLLKFWQNFINENQTNFSIILPYLEQLFQIILLPQPDASNFTYQSLQLSKLQLWKASNSVIDILMTISKNLDLRNNLIHIRAGKQYLKILRGFTKTSSKPYFNILSNQKQILHLLLQQFRNLIDPINYFGEIENISQEKFKQIDILRFQQLKLHSTALNLIADTCQNYYLGISEIQRILLFESLVTICQNGPYVVKAAYLRCIFELYINQVRQNTQINDLIDIQQIKELLNQTIIPDLELMQQFSSTTLIQSTILVSNNEFWKYILYVIKFLISMMDELRIMEKLKKIDFISEFTTVQTLLQGMLLINQKQIIMNNKELILQILKLIKVFTESNCSFNIYSRLLIYCIRTDIQFQDLIKYVESLKIKNNLEKLKEICNKNEKIYICEEDFLKFRKISSKADFQINTDEWIELKSQFSSYHELKEVTEFTERRQNDEKNLQDLKEEFALKKEENLKQRLSQLKSVFKCNNFLTEDVQIFLFLDNLLKQPNNFLQIEQLKNFLIECKQIFTNHSQYLIKLCRVLLEIKKPSQQFFLVDQNNCQNNVEEQIEEYVQYQNIISESEIDLLALDQLNQQNMKQQLDALTFLQLLLDFGNAQVQQRLFVILKIKKKRKNFVQFFKDFFNIDVGAQIEVMRIKENTQYEQLCIKVLQLLQGLCENVHLEFQKFLRIQNETDSITNNFNFITETTNLLVNFLVDKSIDEQAKLELYQQGMQSLIEFSTGLNDNKREITKSLRLFQAFNKLFSEFITDQVLSPLKKNDQKDHYKILQSLSIYIKLLISLLDGNIEENKQVYKFLYDIVDISFLLQLAKKIYHLRIFPKKNHIFVDRYCKDPCHAKFCHKSFCVYGYKTKEDSLLIETALNIFVIGLKLSSINQDEKYDIFKFETATYDQQLIRENQEFNTQPDEILYEKTFSLSYRPQFYQAIYVEVSTDELNEQIQDDIIEEQADKKSKPISISRKDEFFQFFGEFIGRIEVVNQQGKIERILFQKPFVCKYVTPNIEQHLIFESNRETDEDRIASLMDNIDFYHSQMIHYQRVSTIPIMHFGQKHWRKLKDFSYILCVFIVLFYIIWPKDIMEGNLYSGDDEYVYDEEGEGEGEEEAHQYQESQEASIVLVINNIITIIQLVLNFFIILFCAVERYPIAINYRGGGTNIKLIQNLKKEAGFRIPDYKMKYYDALGYLENNFDKKKASKNPLRKILLLLILDFDNFYNVVIFGITIIAFFNTSIYCILLLDIIKRSEVLQYIIKAFTENTQNLLVFGLLGLIGLIQFGFIINASLYDQFKDEQSWNSDSLGYTIAHVINFGLRAGGGVGESLGDYADPFKDPHKYWKRYFNDLGFFIIFNMIFNQMIFGIIVDKFGELRDERSDLLKDIEGKCFICSLDRNVIDSKTKNGWYYHIYLEHNVYHMLFYLIYIKMKPITECNKLEKYIKDQIENKQSDFFPFQTTLELQEQE